MHTSLVTAAWHRPRDPARPHRSARPVGVSLRPWRYALRPAASLCSGLAIRRRRWLAAVDPGPALRLVHPRRGGAAVGGLADWARALARRTGPRRGRPVGDARLARALAC